MKTFISIIVPCYNQAQYLDECLQSVLDQTYQNWECIIVNDGSPDNTEEIALQWTAKDPRFTYLKKENGGLSSARNAGIEIAKGEWILPLDSDDKIGNQYLELAEKEFENYDLVYCKLQLFGSEEKLLNVREYCFKELLYFNPFFCSTFFKKQEWKKIGGYDIQMRLGLEDWEFWINMIYNSNNIYKVKKIEYLGFYYRRKKESMNTLVNDNGTIQQSLKKYIVTKHAKWYAQSIDVINNEYVEKARIQKYLNQYNLLFSKNFIGKILFAIANKLNKK